MLVTLLREIDDARPSALREFRRDQGGHQALAVVEVRHRADDPFADIRKELMPDPIPVEIVDLEVDEPPGGKRISGQIPLLIEPVARQDRLVLGLEQPKREARASDGQIKSSGIPAARECNSLPVWR